MLKRLVKNNETLGFVIGNMLFLKSGGGGSLNNHKMACDLATRLIPGVELVNAEFNEIRYLLFTGEPA